MTDQRIALVTGANRGLGLAICEQLANRGYTIALAARDFTKAEEAATALSSPNRTVIPFALDVSNTTSVREAARAIYDRCGRIDVLVNNAGVYPENNPPNDGTDGRPKLGLATDPEVVLDTLNINTVGPYRVLQAVLPVMRENNYGRIVNVSSQMARLSTMNAGSPAYRMSKTGLNALTAVLQAELDEDSNIKVNSADPGWVRTDMGGGAADRSIEEGIDTIVWLATLPDDGPSGGFYRDRKETDW